ncbi:unnamed protein product [Phytophthora fragariaefolia]|uniref:Unnamed protein product n=1 Tax=Phytophthora fragariaefolia TaxID=1490495 RepID=A0A9W6XZZ3_9STRA|nr:unnamed protein product [Phytophthora fragariaefolia]
MDHSASFYTIFPSETNAREYCGRVDCAKAPDRSSAPKALRDLANLARSGPVATMRTNERMLVPVLGMVKPCCQRPPFHCELQLHLMLWQRTRIYFTETDSTSRIRLANAVAPS